MEPRQLSENFKSPNEMFQTLGLPIKNVEGVVKEGIKKFIYKGEVFSRVELVAKKFYEQRGCLVTWSEGMAFEFLRKSTSMYLCSKLCEGYKYHPNILSSPRSNMYTWPVDGVSPIEPMNLMVLASYLKDHAYHDLAGAVLPEANAGQIAYYDSIISPNPLFELMVSRSDLAKLYLDAKNQLSADADKLLAPFLQELSSEYVSSGKDKYGSVPYILEFCSELLSQGAYSDCFNEFEFNEVPGVGFDLMVWDKSEKSIKFVEVKNKDKFTTAQLSAVSRYLALPVVPIELCLVQAA